MDQRGHGAQEGGDSMQQARQGADTPVRYLKGVGERRGALYEKLGIYTVRDLLHHYPREYIDCTSPSPIAQAPFDRPVAVRCTVVDKGREQRIRKGLSIFKVRVTDGADDMVVTFFNARFTVEALKPEVSYLFYGKVQGTLTHRQMSAPLVFPADSSAGLLGVYPLTHGLSSRMIAANVRQALGLLGNEETDLLPEALRRQFGLYGEQRALWDIHFPPDAQALEAARRRLIFEELFTLSLALGSMKGESRAIVRRALQPVDLSPFFASLPFSPTAAQRRVIDECAADLVRTRPMHRLVQGDVGSGKTLVAAAAAYFVQQNGAQAALLAPTEILAAQHYRTLSQLLGPLGVTVCLLTGSTPAAEKRRVRAALLDGSCHLAVDTHALIEQSVAFRDLALVVTDEQHRFGVAQRTALAQKGEGAHVMVMSATPIPRTLAFVVYGDLDISVIDEMPTGRVPASTWLIAPEQRERAYAFIRRFLDQGRQAYVVCPLIEEEDPEEATGLQTAVEYAERMRKIFAGHKVGLLHGRMKAAEKDAVMQQFAAGEIGLLVATTVIEVGVDVPNAVVMLIENAERFGLSQLHQLRGRIGRGGGESHCILVSQSSDIERLSVIRRTTDGFRIAEEDLRLRGPGDFFGTRQHGLPQLKIADALTDVRLVAQVQQAAAGLLRADPALEAPEHTALRDEVRRIVSRAGL